MPSTAFLILVHIKYFETFILYFSITEFLINCFSNNHRCTKTTLVKINIRLNSSLQGVMFKSHLKKTIKAYQTNINSSGYCIKSNRSKSCCVVRESVSCNTTGATCGPSSSKPDHPSKSRSTEITPSLWRIRVAKSLVFYVVFVYDCVSVLCLFMQWHCQFYFRFMCLCV